MQQNLTEKTQQALPIHQSLPKSNYLARSKSDIDELDIDESEKYRAV